MLRYLIWRLRFEACNIKRLLGPGDERVHYLAFGANLSDAILRQRRITPISAQPFTLRGYGLRFDHPAPWCGCGYASAEPAPGESLHGFLYTLYGRDAARMDFYEVVPVLNRYRRTVVEQDGIEVYFYQTNRATPGLKPTDEYLGYIVEGLKSHPEVNQSYLDKIEALETGEPGAMVSSYHSARPPRLSGWQKSLADAYSRLSLKLFIRIIYPFSPTAALIKRPPMRNRAD